MGDSDRRVSHSEVLPNYGNMLRKGKQTLVELWAADNLFVEKDVLIQAFECCRLFSVSLGAIREPCNTVISQ